MSDLVVVVAAGSGLADYERFGVYICQANRSFRPCSHMGFYARGSIDARLPKILGAIERVRLSPAGIATLSDGPERRMLLSVADQLQRDNDKRFDALRKVVFLSGPDDPETIHLPHRIENDYRTPKGNLFAFVMAQRYVPLAAIRAAPKTTMELLRRSA